MANLMDKINLIIKREKKSPERKHNDDNAKSSHEILSELFGVFNAAPPKIDESTFKKSKKNKKKHKKEKKKRSRSSSSSSESDDDSHSKKRKKKKKKSKKSKRSSAELSPYRVDTPPPPIKIDPDLILSTKAHLSKQYIKYEKDYIKTEKQHVDNASVKTEKIKSEPHNSFQEEISRSVSTKTENDTNFNITFDNFDPSQIPMPGCPKDKLDNNDLRLKLDSKSKIQIKNLKFSAVFEETVKKAEEEAQKKKAKYEEGELSDSSSSLEQLESSQFPKSWDPSGILQKKAAEEKAAENDKKKSKHSESSRKSSHRDRSRSPHRQRHRSRSGSRSRRHRSGSRSRRHGSRHRNRSRSPYHSRSHRSDSRHARTRISPRRTARSSRSPSSGVRLKDSEKKRLLEVARKNAINMLKNGAVPAGAAALPAHTRNQVMAAIQSGGKSVDELTDFCKHLSKKEALGELTSASSNDEISDNEDTRAFHHPFLVKEKAPIVMNIRGGAPLPVKSTAVALVNKDELRMQFPVSSGSQHREKSTEWIPVSPKKDETKGKETAIAKVTSKPKPPPSEKSAMLALTAPPPVPAPVPAPVLAPSVLPTPSIPIANSSPLALPAPGPQAYPPGIKPPNPSTDIAALVCQKLSRIRQEQELSSVSHGFGRNSERHLGQFTGSTGANILTPRELASGMQAWAKKDQLVKAAPVRGGMGMALLQKMGWTPGQGLGKEGTGTLQPLLLEVKLDTKGLVAREELGGRVNKAKARNVPAAMRRAAGGAGGGPVVAGGKHPVSLLGEYCSKNKLGPPDYDLCFECGPDHKKHFLFKVRVAGVEYQPATASANKKQAKADSATLALQKLGVLPA